MSLYKLSHQQRDAILNADVNDWKELLTKYGIDCRKDHANNFRRKNALPPFKDDRKRWNYNESFFSDKSLRSCYWAGFIAADGCIKHLKNGQPILAIKINSEDRKHLSSFLEDIGGGHISDGVETKTSGSTSRYSAVQIVSQKIVSGLNEFGIFSRKTMTLNPPENLDDRQQMAFIAGYIDGDGSYTYARTSNGLAPVLSIAGTREILEWILDKFGCVQAITKSSNIYVTSLYGSKAKNSREMLYVVESEIPLLPRKYKRWESLGIDLELW